MTTEQKIAAIIEDCCAIDPAFHGREAELRPLIKRLLESQPDTKFDDAFAKRLRDAVLAQAASHAPAAKPSFWERLRHLKRDDVFVLGGAALGLVLAVVLTVSSLSIGAPKGSIQLAAVPRSDSFAAPAPAPVTGITVTPLASGAFGSVAGSGVSAGGAQTATGPGFGRGGGGGGIAAAPVAQPSAAGGKVAVMPIDYQPINYRFVYKGELSAPDASVDVYRRVKGFAGGSVPLAALGKISAGTVDLTGLETAALQNFTLTENREFGYMVMVDANEGTVSFGQNWLKWPHPENSCTDDKCMQQYRLTPEQMPGDAAAIAVADDFLRQYGIAKDSYGTPEVRSDWRVMYAAATDKTSVYLPDSVAVVYPLKLDGKPVQADDGAAYGMTVSVNVRHMRVDGMWGLSSGAYERSSYPSETDTKRLMAFVEQGGIWGGWNADPAAKTVDVQLGDPEIVLTLSWKPREDGMSDELYVPALRFPVLNPPADQPWFRKAVLVPLVKETLDAAVQPGAVPEPPALIRNK